MGKSTERWLQHFKDEGIDVDNPEEFRQARRLHGAWNCPICKSRAKYLNDKLTRQSHKDFAARHLTKEDIKKYGTEEEIKLLEMHHDGTDYVSDENDADGPFTDKGVLGVDDIQYAKNRRREASGSMTNFVEMGNYWGKITKIKRDDESWITSFHIKDGDPDGDAPKGTKFKEADVTIDKFLETVDAFIKNPKKYNVDPSNARAFIGDEWDSDVGTDDIIVQIIVFGELIYG